MSDSTPQEPIDVEFEDHDELIELAPAPGVGVYGHLFPTPASGVDDVEAFVNQASKYGELAKSEPSPARIDPDQLDWWEDYAILRILYGKIFRKAINAGVELPAMPDIEAQALEASGGLDEAWHDLDDAKEGKTDLDWQLDEWRKALAK